MTMEFEQILARTERHARIIVEALDTPDGMMEMVVGMIVDDMRDGYTDTLDMMIRTAKAEGGGRRWYDGLGIGARVKSLRVFAARREMVIVGVGVEGKAIKVGRDRRKKTSRENGRKGGRPADPEVAEIVSKYGCTRQKAYGVLRKRRRLERDWQDVLAGIKEPGDAEIYRLTDGLEDWDGFKEELVQLGLVGAADMEVVPGPWERAYKRYFNVRD